MRILFFHRWVGVHKGGTETHIRELADRFQKMAHEVTILTREGNELNGFNPAVKIIRIPKNIGESDHSYEDFRVYIHTLFFMAKAFFKLFCLLTKPGNFDVISVHFFTELWVAKVCVIFKKIPIVFVLEGYTSLEAKAAKFADRKISISSFEAEMYRKNHSLESVVIPIGIDLARFSVSKSSTEHLIHKFAPNKEKIALTVCRLEPRKDLFTLIKAVKYLEEKVNSIKFLIVGDGISRKQIEKEIQVQGLENRILLPGRIDDSDLPYYYACADFFILPTKQEWFGIVFVEAMASGLPIITTTVGACPEVAGECGLYFKSEDHVALAEKIMELSDNNLLLQNLSKCSIRRAGNFDWNKVIKKYEEQYNFLSN